MYAVCHHAACRCSNSRCFYALTRKDGKISSNKGKCLVCLRLWQLFIIDINDTVVHCLTYFIQISFFFLNTSGCEWENVLLSQYNYHDHFYFTINYKKSFLPLALPSQRIHQHAHLLAVSSLDKDLLYSHRGSVGHYTDFVLGAGRLKTV